MKNSTINSSKYNDIELYEIENLIEQDISFLTSYHVLEESRKINIFSTLILILFGLIGNSLIIFVFSQKRFRTNSSNVYLFCLAINDSLFLLIHFIEDTVKNYQRIFIYDEYTYLNDNDSFVNSNETIFKVGVALFYVKNDKFK